MWALRLKQSLSILCHQHPTRCHMLVLWLNIVLIFASHLQTDSLRLFKYRFNQFFFVFLLLPLKVLNTFREFANK